MAYLAKSGHTTDRNAAGIQKRFAPELARSYDRFRMNVPEGEITDPQDEAAEKDLPLDEIKKQKPIVHSSSVEGGEDKEPEDEKPDLPPAMPPLM
ncbi:MAG: hypothetical protein JO069_12240 [Verrucomicrobia bacterium]|nr:hypothetical protein [Verrucomicrobiota bacterium]